MNHELYIERLDQYATGSMSDPERAAFELELKENPELREALALYRESEAVIEQSIENNLRQQFQSWAAADHTTQPIATGKPEAKVISLRTVVTRWAVAASVLLVAGFFYLYQSSQNLSDQSLFAANYEAPEDGPVRGDAAPVDPISQGAEAFNNKNYAVARTFFNQIPATDAPYAEAQYYLGHIALQQQQYDDAITAFEKTVQANDTRFTDKAQWNLVLTYLAANRTEDAGFKALLATLAGDVNHSYYEQAKALEGKLGSFGRRFVG